MSQTTITSKGQVTIPKNIRDYLGLHSGDKIEFVFTENDEVILKPITKKVDEVFGILHKPGMKAVTVEEMEAGIKQKIRESFL
jgi:antitoxin PrlF